MVMEDGPVKEDCVDTLVVILLESSGLSISRELSLDEDFLARFFRGGSFLALWC